MLELATLHKKRDNQSYVWVAATAGVDSEILEEATPDA